MKRTLLRAIPALLISAFILCGGVTAYAASDTVDALHNGPAPTYSSQPMTTPAPDTPAPTTQTDPADPQAPLDTSPETEATTPAPSPIVAPALPALYPSNVQDTAENGVRQIVKTYELDASDDPAAIPRESFELDGWQYTLTDIVKNETASTGTRDHTETVTVKTDTKDLTAIIGLLDPTMDFTDEDGYTGALSLDISTIKVETAGTKTSSYTASATREYPHLSDNDTSLIPKTITDSGRTLTLQSVNWRADSTEAVDYDQIPTSYTAVATYTAVASKTVVTGYITTADYSGTLAKLIEGKTVYTAYFVGAKIVPPTPEPTPIPDPEPEQKSANVVPIAAASVAGAGVLGGLVFVFFARKNVKVHNLKDGKYLPIGKTKVTARNPIINLTPFANKAATGSFILVMDRLAAKQLTNKTVTVNYGDKSLQHIVQGGGGEYQFEIDF